jgi:hypothetical protein
MKTTIELIKIKTAQINQSSNEMQGSALWNKTVQLVKIYFKENKITEISIPNFESLFGLNRDNTKKMLIQINKALFA